jgi:hypothetical protein
MQRTLIAGSTDRTSHSKHSICPLGKPRDDRNYVRLKGELYPRRLWADSERNERAMGTRENDPSKNFESSLEQRIEKRLKLEAPRAGSGACTHAQNSSASSQPPTINSCDLSTIPRLASCCSNFSFTAVNLNWDDEKAAE